MRQLNSHPLFQELKEMVAKQDYDTIARTTDSQAALAYHNFVSGRKSLFDYVGGMARTATEMDDAKTRGDMADNM